MAIPFFFSIPNAFFTPSLRTFSREHLAQIVAVAPDAYVLRPTLVKDSQLGEGRYELVILARRAQKSADGAVVEAEGMDNWTRFDIAFS